MQEQAEIEEVTSEAVSVEIYDQIYRLRGTDLAYLEHLARLVDDKMRTVSAQGGTVDSLRVAVLAALNLADQLECMRERHAKLAGSMTQNQTTMRSRSASLVGMLDEVFAEADFAEPEQIRRAG